MELEPGAENALYMKMQDMKLQDLKMQDMKMLDLQRLGGDRRPRITAYGSMKTTANCECSLSIDDQNTLALQGRWAERKSMIGS